MRRTLADIDRLTVVADNGCHVFTGTCTADGYGRMQIGGVRRMTHVWVWIQAHGLVPTGMHVLHHCDNPPCRLLEHLYLGTDLDNNRDRERRGRGVRLQGSQHPNAKLTEEIVMELRKRYAAGESAPKLAQEIGVSRATVWLAVTGRAWQIVGA